MGTRLRVFLGLLACTGFLLPLSAHPTLDARDASSLKRVKRAWNCSEVAVFREPLKELKYAPRELEVALRTTNTLDGWKWSSLVQDVGEKEDRWEGRRDVVKKTELCKGRVEGKEPGNDVVLVKTESSAQVCTKV